MSDAAKHLPGLIWSVTDLLRGDFRTSEYGSVVLPFTVLRRLDCILAPTRQNVLDRVEWVAARGIGNPDPFLRRSSGYPFYNTSRIALDHIAFSPEAAERLLLEYVDGFSENVRVVMERFEFDRTVKRLHNAGLLYRIVSMFLTLDLGPTLSPNEMGLAFEELVRHAADQAKDSSNGHITPRDVARLMISLLTATDTETLTVPGVARKVFDPVCATGGLLSEAAEYIAEINPESYIDLCGQEANPETWAIARSNMLMSGHDPENMRLGDVVREDAYPGEHFDYLLARPPFGAEWKKFADAVQYEYEVLGARGRFGAGLPRITDGSLLYLQHMLAKMRPTDASVYGGSRIAIVFNRSPMHVGAAGSGESEIRKWLIENDWLEGIVALPDQLFYNTGIGTYLWVLSNRKSAELRGRVVVLNAQSHWQKMRRSVGSKRKYIGPDQLGEITKLYSQALSANTDHPQFDRVRIMRNEELGYRQIVVERPLRLRYQLSRENLTRLATLRPIQRANAPGTIEAALRQLVGTTWDTKSEAFAALRRAAEANGQTWPSNAPFDKAVRNVIGVRDAHGELQQLRGKEEADPELRELVTLPLHLDPEEHFRSEVLPRTPDAWVDHSKTRVGYEIPAALFFVPEIDGLFEPLRNFARLDKARIKRPRSTDGENGSDRPKHLRAQDLHTIDSAIELSDAPATGPALRSCAGGDLVGYPGNWRLLPPGFGDAATSMFVLHPLQGSGRGLCEWLNSRTDNGQFPQERDLLDTPVPVDLVTDEEVDDLLEHVQESRRKLRTSTSGILPNVFASSETTIEQIRKDIRFAAYEARLVGELVRPLDDPVWRAEWSYPFHVAALARQYRISTHPAERMDGLLKLGEGVARTLGVLALSELIADGGFTRTLRRQFRWGATFGTWLWLVDQFVEANSAPRLPELAALRERDTTRSLLEEIKNFRNRSHHAHGVRPSHQLDKDIEELEPRVVSAISSVNWLSGTHWHWVERCEYLGESSYSSVGLRLRGSHPSWEPFERSSTYPLRPNRIYVDTTPSGTPLDLWPLAAVSLCQDCQTRELFLLIQVQDGQLVFRSLEEHSLEIPYDTSRTP